MWQTIVAYGLLIVALGFLVRKYFFKSNKKKGHCDKNCNC